LFYQGVVTIVEFFFHPGKVLNAKSQNLNVGVGLHRKLPLELVAIDKEIVYLKVVQLRAADEVDETEVISHIDVNV